MSPPPHPLRCPGESRYQYLSDDHYFDPLVGVKKRSPKDTNEILQSESNFWPREGQSWRSIRQLLDHQKGDTKLFFVARHGHSEHNKSQETYGIDCFNAASELSGTFHDPDLTAEGQEQARKLGDLLKGVLLDELGAEPRDVGFYSSSLKRCISTAGIAARTVFRGNAAATRPTKRMSPPRGRPSVIVLDELREWLGWDHNVATDRRSSKADITRAFRDADLDLVFKADFPEEDVMCQKETIQESWVDVRRRWERALDWIYDNDARKYIFLSSNNRSLQCGLHVLGLPLDAGLVEKHKKITVVNMANCAVLAFVVRRQALSDPEVLEKEMLWAALELKEQDVIMALRVKEKAAKENLASGDLVCRE